MRATRVPVPSETGGGSQIPCSGVRGGVGCPVGARGLSSFSGRSSKPSYPQSRLSSPTCLNTEVRGCQNVWSTCFCQWKENNPEVSKVQNFKLVEEASKYRNDFFFLVPSTSLPEGAMATETEAHLRVGVCALGQLVSLWLSIGIAQRIYQSKTRSREAGY